MDDQTTGTGTPPGGGRSDTASYYKRDFWSKENLKFVQPHFRLEKAGHIVNRIARRKECNLLDVGCGPATLMHLVPENVHYYGIDIAIHDPEEPNLLETDFLEAPISFGGKRFDIILAQGVFEYLGAVQAEKFAEIRQLLTPDGKFVVSYWNFGHLNRRTYEAFSNIQPLSTFREGLERYFSIDRFFPVGHNWYHGEPGRKVIKAAQMHFNLNIPLISPAFAVEYFFICSSRPAKKI